MQEVARLPHVFPNFRPGDFAVVQLVLVLVAAWPRGHVVLDAARLRPHAVLDVGLRLFGVVEARTRLGLHFEGVNFRFDSGGELRASIRVAFIVVFTGAWMLHELALETVVARH